MLTQRAPVLARFTRSDATRLAIAATSLVLALTAILAVDLLPSEAVRYEQAAILREDLTSPKATSFDSTTLTDQARTQARAAVPFQYDFTSEKAIAIAAAQANAFNDKVRGVDTAFATDLSQEQRTALLGTAIPGLTETAHGTLLKMDAPRWAAVRTEAARVLDATVRTELRDTEVAETRNTIASQMAGDLDDAERMLAAEIIAPLVVPNSSFSQTLTNQARDRAAEDVAPVIVNVAQGQVVVRNGEPLTAADLEVIQALGLGQDAPLDVSSLAGWFLLAVLTVTLLLAWIWRFRPTFWHRDNVLLLIGLLVVGTTLALKVTAGRELLGYFLPTAAIGMLLTILLDASVATIVIALIAVIGGAIAGGSLEFASYIFLGGLAGIVSIRKGDRFQVFVQAAIGVFVVNALVVSVFSLLGTRDVRGVLELWFASAVSAAGSSVAAVGTFAVLGSAFGILTVFQLLELANPSQPLLRRLLSRRRGPTTTR